MALEPYNLRRWRESGTMTRDGVLQLIDEQLDFHWHRRDDLLDNFSSVCMTKDEGIPYWTESILSNYLAHQSKGVSVYSNLFDEVGEVDLGTQQTKVFPRFLELPGEIQDLIWFFALLDPLFVEAGPILYSTALYCGNFPFVSNPYPDLTYEILRRAVYWLDPILCVGSSYGSLGDRVSIRYRTLSDHRRLLFQSLAEPGRNIVEFDVDRAKLLAFKAAFDIAEDLQDYGATNYDDDGDQIYHDVVDTFAWLQPTYDINQGGTVRDDFRSIAKEFHDPNILLYHLSIPENKFKTLVKLLLSRHLIHKGQIGGDIRPRDLSTVAECIVNAFKQDGLITWESFDFVLTHKTSSMFVSLSDMFDSLIDQVASPTEFPTFLLPKPGKILTYPVLNQLAFFLDWTIPLHSIELVYQYRPGYSTRKTSDIIDALKNSPKFSLLFISGKTSAGDEMTVGAYISSSEEADQGIAPRPEGIDGSHERTMLFQLKPVHDIFRSRVGDKAWTLTGSQDICFGDCENGVAIILMEYLRDVKVSHKTTEGTYEATKWRGDWEVSLSVSCVEIWTKLY